MRGGRRAPALVQPAEPLGASRQQRGRDRSEGRAARAGGDSVAEREIRVSHNKLLVLGGTGGTGRTLIAQALDAGHDVTALVRDRARVPLNHARLRLVEGDLVDARSPLADAMRGQHAVISALGRGTSFRADGLIERSVPQILAAMQTNGVRRLIFTSAIGVGDSIRDAPLFSKLMIRLLLGDIYADKAAGEAFIRRSDLDWTLVQPAQLTNGPLTRRYRAGERLALRGIPRISRADVAHFLLGQLDDPTHIRKVVLLAY
jgi:putative NADH-flavin reductase